MRLKLILILCAYAFPFSLLAQNLADGDIRNETLAKARYLRSIYKTEAAIEMLSELVSLDVFDEEVFAELAECHYQSSDFQTAIGTYFLLSSKAPEKVLYKIRMMQSFYRLRDYLNSIMTGHAVLQLDSIPAVAGLIGDSFRQLDMPDSALVYYKKSLELKPVNESIVSKTANILISNKEYDEAISLTERFLEERPDNSAVAPLCALAYYRKGNYTKVIDILQKQEDEGNDSYAVHFYLGHAYWRDKTIDRAEEELLSAWQIDSTDANLACSIAGVKADRFALFGSEVKPWLDKAMSLMQPVPETMARIHQGLALGYFKNLSFDKAIEHYKEAYRYDPEFRAAVSTIGYCYEQKKDYKRALEWYEKYLKLVPPGSKGYEQITDNINYVKSELFMEEK